MEILAEELHYRAKQRGPPYDVCAVARALGYRVATVPSLGGPTGILAANTIVVTGHLCPGVRAITIGHELGHAIARECSSVVATWPAAFLERQMDAVAAALLMPRSDAGKAIVNGIGLRDAARLFAPLPFTWVAARMRRIMAILRPANVRSFSC